MSDKLKRTLIINSGGESKRIKESLNNPLSKSWISINNEPIIIRNLNNLGSQVKEIIIVTRNDEEKLIFKSKLNSLRSLLKFPFEKINLIVDERNIKISGPLRGILTAIHHCQNEIIWWIPSDYPYISSDLFTKLESKLSKSNIVSIYNNARFTDFHFEPQIFVSSKLILKNYSFFAFNRITDLYRLIPDVTFLTLLNKEEYRSLIGINTVDDLKLLNSNNHEPISKENQFILINRFCKVNNDLTNVSKSSNVKNLFDNSQFFLLRRMIELNIIEKNFYPVNKLTYLEWKFWKNKNEIIAFHCGKDYLRMDETNEKEKAEILEFMKGFSLNS